MKACPDLDVLRRLREGELSDETFREVESHVQSCATCQQGLDRMRTPLPIPLPVAMAVGLASLPPNTTPPRATIDADEAQPRYPAVPGYEILGELGRGGMGVVYQARHVVLDRVVAIKMIRGDALPGEPERARFGREVKAVARLRHAGVVQIHEVGEVDGRPYYAMEYVEGGSLRDERERRSAREVALVIEQVARAAHAMHVAGVVHRDSKPGNVLLTADGAVKIADFGLAHQEEVGQTLTESGAILGTPGYMAPEQARGKSSEHPVGAATDVWALGAILYELLTGKPPFQGADRMDTLMRTLSDEPTPPRKARRDCPRDLETICLKCLEKVPGERYASAEALADDLGRFASGRPIEARRSGRRRVWAMVAGAVVAVGALFWAVSGTPRVKVQPDENPPASVRVENNEHATKRPEFTTRGRSARVRFDDRDNEVEVLHYQDDQLALHPQFGFARRTQRYDDKNNLVEVACFGPKNEPVICSDGYARQTAIFGAYGERQVAFLGVHGEPVNSVKGYHRALTRYDAQGRVAERAYLGADGELARMKDSGTYRTLHGYDERGRKTEVSNLGPNGRLTNNDSGWAKEERNYAPTGSLWSLALWTVDKNGQLTRNHELERTIEAVRRVLEKNIRQPFKTFE